MTDWKERYEIAPWMIKIEPDTQNGLKKTSAADCFQVRLFSQKRFVKRIGIVSEKIIDKINILEASKLAMEKSILDLKNKIQSIDFILIDGNFKIKTIIPQKSIIKGDYKVFSIATASIIAKVVRDRIMLKYHNKYPLYGFDKHKGYGTKLHFQMLKKYGPCKIHRKTFNPIPSLINRP